MRQHSTTWPMPVADDTQYIQYTVQRANNMHALWIMVLLALTSGCIVSHVSGPKPIVPLAAPASPIVYIGHNKDYYILSEPDRHSIEAIVGRIREVGNPVYVSQVFFHPSYEGTVVYRSPPYDVYVSRVTSGCWKFVKVEESPIP